VYVSLCFLYSPVFYSDLLSLPELLRHCGDMYHIKHLLQSIKSCIYTGWAKKTGPFLDVDNFAMVSGRKVCDMLKVCKFCLEKKCKTCIAVIYIEFFPYCLFVSNSQVIGCEDRLRNDLYCVGWGVKLYSI